MTTNPVSHRRVLVHFHPLSIRYNSELAPDTPVFQEDFEITNDDQGVLPFRVGGERLSKGQMAERLIHFVEAASRATGS